MRLSIPARRGGHWSYPVPNINTVEATSSSTAADMPRNFFVTKPVMLILYGTCKGKKKRELFKPYTASVGNTIKVEHTALAK